MISLILIGIVIGILLGIPVGCLVGWWKANQGWKQTVEVAQL